MRLSRRGLILGGSAMLAGCATAPAAVVETPIVLAAAPPPPPLPPIPQITPPPLDPRRLVRPDLMSRAMAALDVHSHRITLRDRMYLVDFQKFSGDARMFEVDLIGGRVTAFRTSHGRGSDPEHSGFARRFSNTPESYMSSVGAYATAGAGWGSQQGPNVLLDGLEYSNNLARDRAIIVHGADYADPEFLAREGKLGRSYGCFSTAHTDLPMLRERMGEGRLLFAYA
ncbi:murein L,D-transpeptidase catalytic domain-containing protein [Brevundimonas sp.]|uniref:murein L,D-transpeptidase catalytic domain-containing protein n=1 Tax=Brevundimonas sp. TaxID=1871086 RepID=UPI00260687B6|nr:murein L,D-transpeptidase catalytic domain family protein [Brevundimonas sp.]